MDLEKCIILIKPKQRLHIPGITIISKKSIGVSSGSWWNNNGAISGCVAAYAPKGSSTLEASYINLANPGTYNAAPGIAPTWDATGGWTGNGTTQYLTTGITPTFGWSVIVRFSNVTNSGSLFGSVGAGTKRFTMYPNAASPIVYGYDVANVRPPALLSGVLAMTIERGYRNGSADGADFSATSGSIGRAMLLLARDNNGIIGDYIAAKIQAFAIYSTTLTAGEVSTLTTLMNTL